MWQFINTARRMLNVNFEVKWMFAFMMGAEPVHEWTDGMFADFAKYKSANFVVQSIYGPSKSRWKGRNPYSTSFLKVDHGYYREFHKRLRKLFPDGSVKHGIYYHCFIDNYDGNEIRFKEDRRLDSAGNHINYGGRYTYDRLYVPTLDNEFGKETAKVVDAILDEIGADGIFWDEFRTSRGEYTYNRWDGCSADIDQTTGKITRLNTVRTVAVWSTALLAASGFSPMLIIGNVRRSVPCQACPEKGPNSRNQPGTPTLYLLGGGAGFKVSLTKPNRGGFGPPENPSLLAPSRRPPLRSSVGATNVRSERTLRCLRCT